MPWSDPPDSARAVDAGSLFSSGISVTPVAHGACKAGPRRRIPRLSGDRTMSTTLPVDPHAQLRSLYMSLLSHQERFDEFKRLLALYDVKPEQLDAEPLEAADVRERLNERIRTWIGGRFDGLSAAQALQWRAIVVEERFNVSLSPWKESNGY
jgi:hypothetical protein